MALHYCFFSSFREPLRNPRPVLSIARKSCGHFSTGPFLAATTKPLFCLHLVQESKKRTSAWTCSECSHVPSLSLQVFGSCESFFTSKEIGPPLYDDV